MIRNMAANATALAAIGSRRKRTSTVALQDRTVSVKLSMCESFSVTGWSVCGLVFCTLRLLVEAPRLLEQKQGRLACY